MVTDFKDVLMINKKTTATTLHTGTVDSVWWAGSLRLSQLGCHGVLAG